MGSIFFEWPLALKEQLDKVQARFPAGMLAVASLSGRHHGQQIAHGLFRLGMVMLIREGLELYRPLAGHAASGESSSFLFQVHGSLPETGRH